MTAQKLILTVLVALGAVTGVSCSCAFAEKVYYPAVSIGEPGQNPGEFDEPVGVAVNDTTGDVYVVDKGNNRVEYFNSTGAFENEFNGGGLLPNENQSAGSGGLPYEVHTGRFNIPEGIAIDNDESSASYEDVYVIDAGHKVIDKFSSTGMYEGQLTGASCKERKDMEGVGAPACKAEEEFFPFDNLRGVAVDSSGNVWVYGGFEEEGAYILEFSDKGSFEREFSTQSFSHNNHAIAVDSNEDIFAGGAIKKEIEQFTVEGEIVSTFAEGANALAIVPSASEQLPNQLFVDKGASIARYDPLGKLTTEPLELFPDDVPRSFSGFAESSGLAVNANATVYASELKADKVQSFSYVSVPVVVTEAPSKVTETSLVLHGSVNPENEPLKECYFEYGIENGTYNTVPCKPEASNIVGTKEVAVSAELSHLAPASIRGFHLIVVSAADVERRGASLTVARPAIVAEEVSGVGPTVATVDAQVDSGGLQSCYWIEYGTSAAYGARTPAEGCIDVGGGAQRVSATVELAGLSANTEYHFRIAGDNSLGGGYGEDHVFTTFAASTSELPDGRVDEAVSAVGAGEESNVYVPHGMEETLDRLARHGLFTNLPFQAATDGDAVAFIGDPSPFGGNGNDGIGGGNQYVAKRSPGGGWVQENLNASTFGNRYVGFSENLSTGVVQANESLAGDAPEGYANLYKRSLGWQANTSGIIEPMLGPFEPLVATSPCTTEFGAMLENQLFGALLFGGGNAGTPGVPAFSHLLFEANAAVASTPAASACGAGNDLYDSVEGQLYLDNVLPGGQIEPNATFGRQGPATDNFQSPEISGAISNEGSRVYWSSVEPVHVGLGGRYEERPKALYVRENDTQPESEMEGDVCTEPTEACTAQVDLAEGGPGPSGGGRFWTASSDGSRVFFTDEHKLTPNATAEREKPDLYEYNLDAPARERLTDLSLPAKPEVGMEADVRGVLGTSSDGSYVYFVAGGALALGAQDRICETAKESHEEAIEKGTLTQIEKEHLEKEEEEEGHGQLPASRGCNLYVRHEGVTAFIALLSGEDGDFSHGGVVHEGDWQADSGHRTAEVTPNGHSLVFMSRRSLTGYDNKVNGVPLTEVFVYDTAAGLTCVSCNPSGEPPVGNISSEFTETIPTELRATGDGVWGSFLPTTNSLADYQPRVIADNGDRVFFDSIEPLVPQDENGLLDVYEWERDGAGSCHETRNCVYLLSGGQSSDNSYLIDASSSGDDVFFVSRGQLAMADRGDDDVLYDARVGGVQSVATGATGRGVPPSPPIFATPATVTFNGIGDFPQLVATTRCEKGFVRKHAKCVKNKKKRKATRLRKAKRDSKKARR